MKTWIFFILVLLSPFARTQSKLPFRTSCVSWTFHGFSQGINPLPSLDTIASLGFDGVQLMVNHPTDLEKLWTETTVQAVRRKLKDHKLELVSLVPFFPCIPDLGSSDPAKLQASLKNFERCCQLAQKLGTKQIEIIGPYLSEFNNPVRGNPYFEYKIDPEKRQPEQKLTLQIPDNAHWESIWNRMMGVIKTCSAMAKKHGLLLIIEPHIHSIIPDNNGFLLFWQNLNDTNVRLNADTGWGTQQCEYSPMVIHRSKKHLQIMQFRDVDSQTRNFVPMGTGVVNIAETFRALRASQFNGYISFEEVFMPTAKEDARRFLQLVSKY